MPRFYLGLMLMKFLEIKFAMMEVLLPVTQFSPVSNILPLLHFHLHLKTVVPKRQARSPPKTTVLFRISGGGGRGEFER
jgi:hypothetical protein